LIVGCIYDDGPLLDGAWHHVSKQIKEICAQSLEINVWLAHPLNHGKWLENLSHLAHWNGNSSWAHVSLSVDPPNSSLDMAHYLWIEACVICMAS